MMNRQQVRFLKKLRAAFEALADGIAVDEGHYINLIDSEIEESCRAWKKSRRSFDASRQAMQHMTTKERKALHK